jgi:predicted transcriptional regulator
MPKTIGAGLSRREREIVDVLYRKGTASAAEVLAEMPDPPTYSAVRSILRILEEKGHVRHHEEGKKYIYMPTEPPQSAARSALQQMVRTFFDGSIERVVETFLSDADTKLSGDELERLSSLIRYAKADE